MGKEKERQKSKREEEKPPKATLVFVFDELGVEYGVPPPPPQSPPKRFECVTDGCRKFHQARIGLCTYITST